MNKNIDIGTKIKKYRKDKKYTLKMLSEQTGLSIGFLSQLERGMTTMQLTRWQMLQEFQVWNWLTFLKATQKQEQIR